jgi:hypothetical protein
VAKSSDTRQLEEALAETREKLNKEVHAHASAI